LVGGGSSVGLGSAVSSACEQAENRITGKRNKTIRISIFDGFLDSMVDSFLVLSGIEPKN
jgi:hypothetical protein